MVSPKIHELARRLLVLEAARDATVGNTASGNTASNNVDLAVRVVEQFRVRFTKLAGAHGFNSLLSRALSLAKISAPSLQPVSVSPDGRLVDYDQAQENGAVLVAHLLNLLTTFIGESLTLQLISDVWPGAATGDARAIDTSLEERS